ncbi:MAG: extracellular solute-binding protein [Lachnospiraceae bacterium]|nr:extracellular solute-binding protein [Lachnospiraceae bacterium]
MKAKKIVALCMAAMMTLSLAACGSSPTTGGESGSDSGNQSEPASDVNQESSEQSVPGDQSSEADGASEPAPEVDLSDVIPTETVTLDVYDQLANYSGEQIGWFGQVMLEKFNVKLNIIPEAEGTFQTRMESGNLGDLVIWGNDSDQYLQAIEKGMLFDWNEDDLLQEYGPYIKEHFAAALDKNQKISGGTLYGYGFDVAQNAQARQELMYEWDLRWDLYKELGYPEIKNLDDMVEVLAQMKEICPTDDNGKTTYGVSLFNDWDGDMVMFVKSTASAYYGYDEFGFGLYNPTDQTFHPCLEENGPYLTCLKFYNTLYQRGLLDPDSQTQKYDGMVEDYQNGTAFLNVFNFLGAAMYNSEAHAAEGKMMAPCPPKEATPICYGQNIYGGNRPWTIGSKTEYPELCMAIINWLSTPEGRMTAEYGPEGVCWYYDENGKTCFTDLGRTAKLDGKTQMTDGYSGTFEDGNFKMNNTTWGIDAENMDSNGDVFNYKKWDCNAAEASSEIEADWRAHNNATTFDSLFDNWNYRLAPGTMYSATPRSEELDLIWQQVATCIKNGSWEAIYAKDDAAFDAIVANMISQANDYGYDQCVEFQENEAKLRAAAEDAAMSAQ